MCMKEHLCVFMYSTLCVCSLCLYALVGTCTVGVCFYNKWDFRLLQSTLGCGSIAKKNVLSARETPSSLFSDLCNGDQISIPRFLTALPTHSPAAKPSGSSQAQLGSTWPERFPLWTAAFIFLPPNLHPQAFLCTLFILSSKINHAKVSFLNRSGCLWKSHF